MWINIKCSTVVAHLVICLFYIVGNEIVSCILASLTNNYLIEYAVKKNFKGYFK